MNHFEATYASAHAAREALVAKVLLDCPGIARETVLRHLPEFFEGRDRVVAIGSQIAIEACIRAL